MSNTSAFNVTLDASTEQIARLERLQQAFAGLCNDLAPFVSEHQCWNRVTLHHLKYRDLRARFPDMGSQMVCNAIYAVSKVARLVYQHPSSPYNLKTMAGRSLPAIRFANDCPVYFDSHTLTLTGQKLSMYTMDGRIKFEVQLTVDQKELLAHQRLIEIALSKGAGGKFMLTFYFNKLETQACVDSIGASEAGALTGPVQGLSLPAYLGVEAAE